MATLCPPELSPNIVTQSGSPPKAGMLSATHISEAIRSRMAKLAAPSSGVLTLARRGGWANHPSSPTRY